MMATLVMPDVRRIRERLGYSRDAFAANFALSLSTVRDWERGRRQPDGAAKVLLLVIAQDPDAVRRAIGEGVGQ